MDKSKKTEVSKQESQLSDSNSQEKATKMYSKEMPVPDILDPDDSLMTKFQKTLQEHLSRVDNRLSEEILHLEASIKQAEKELESEGTRLYHTQQEVERQHVTIEQYTKALIKITCLREEKNRGIDDVKQIHKKSRSKLEEERNKKGKLSRELEKLLTLQNRFSDWEKDLNNYLIISKQTSVHDANKRKELINRKQHRDYILSRLEEEVWRIETEIAYLDEQLQSKDREKGDAGRMIVDANTDIEALHKEHKDLSDTWNSVVASIWKRDNVHNQLLFEREETYKSYNELLLQIDKLKEETNKEVEINEHLTSLSFRVKSNIQAVSKLTTTQNEKIVNSELQLIKLAKLGEQTRNDYNAIYVKYQNCLYEEGQINNELQTITRKKNNLEDAIFMKLEDKVIRDKTAQYINELLVNSKKAVLEQEFLVTRTENAYGNSLLELEKLSNVIVDEKKELQEISQRNIEKEKQMNELRKQIKKYETMIERRQRKLLGMNKLIEQILPSIGGEELSPQDLKIVSLEKNIREIQQKIQKAQQFWMRRQGFMISLSQQRDSQLQKLNLLNKEIMIMEQKNQKLEYAFEMLAREEANSNKTLTLLEQKISQMNAKLVAQKDLREELEDKNCIVKNECILSFQDLELDLVKLQRDLRDLNAQKLTLKDELYAVQQESLSWEKKVQVAQETIKKLKEERSAGGVALMKGEIHKMEMRLSHLRRVQEKLIHDMEFCVARRDIMVDKVIGKLKRNPKEKHNQKVVIRKRLCDKRTKIKQIVKGTKQIENAVQELQNQMKDIQDKTIECQEVLKHLQSTIPSLEQEIDRLEVIRCHNLHSLVFKQRKAKLLRDIKNNRYKMLFKNETTIQENLQNERIYRQHLKHTMERIDQDFPLLKNGVRKILLTLQIL